MSTPIQNTKIQELIQGRIAPGAGQNVQGSGPDFGSIFDTSLKVSGHAQTRLQSRNIQLGKAEWDRVMSGVTKAAAKGARESLVLMDDVALVVSIKNKTVITVVDKEKLKENVFTNIDSAVIV